MKKRMMMTLMTGLRRLGWPGGLGIAALLLAGLLELGLARRWEDQAQDLEAQALRLQGQLRRQQLQEAAAPAPLAPEQWLQRQLPSAQQREQRLADLLELSLRAGLAGSRTEHRLSVDAATGLERLRVSMPVQGTYAQLRGFIEAALRQDLALSLDSLKLRRASPAAGELEAELGWSLHARSVAAGAQRP